MSINVITMLTYYICIYYILFTCVLDTNELTDNTAPANYPYSKPVDIPGRISLGPNMSLAFPTWLLSIILIVFMSIVGYIIKLIFDNEKIKQQKDIDKQKKKQDKLAKKQGQQHRSNSRKDE